MPNGDDFPVGDRAVLESEHSRRIVICVKSRDPFPARQLSHGKCELRSISPFLLAWLNVLDLGRALADSLDGIANDPPLRPELGGIRQVPDLASATVITGVVRARRLDPVIRCAGDRSE